MAEENAYDMVVRAEIAIEILDRARGIVTARIHELEADDPVAAEDLRRRRLELVDLQHAIHVNDRETVENVIATWSPRVNDESLFWREF